MPAKDSQIATVWQLDIVVLKRLVRIRLYDYWKFKISLKRGAL